MLDNVSRDIFGKFGISNLPQSPDIGKTQTEVSPISRFLVNPYERTSNDIDMKLGPVAKLNKINKTTSKKCGDDAMLTKCDVIVIFVILASLEQPTSRSPDA